MNTLFDIGPVAPGGFDYLTNFISTEEEEQLLASIRQFDLGNMKFHQYVAKRKVASFGLGWSFTEQQLKQGAPIPNEFLFLINRVAKQVNIQPEAIVQLLVTEYPPGAVINWHRDAPPFDIIIGISLLADCSFKLRPYAKQLQSRHSSITLPVQRRSFYSLQGIAKNEWEHSTAPLKKTRYSLTFRTLK